MKLMMQGIRRTCITPYTQHAIYYPMRNLLVLSASRRWHRSYRTINVLRLFSVSSCLKITHCDTYSGRIWKDSVHQCKVLDISSVFSMKVLQDPHIDNVFFCQNPVENCTQIFPRCEVNREKSDGHDVFRYDRSARRLLRHHSCSSTFDVMGHISAILTQYHSISVANYE
jgi:hypothetical protein